MASLTELQGAFMKADAAGDTEAAQVLANAVRKAQSQQASAQADTQKFEQEISAAPVEEMSGFDKFRTGMGRGFAATGQGLKQVGLQLGDTLGIVDPSSVEQYRQQIADEKRLFDQLADQSLAAKSGEVFGTIAATAPTMVIPGGAATQLGTRAASAAAGGAVGAMAQPVYEGDFLEEKAKQGATGAAFSAGATFGLDKLRNLMPRNLLARLAKKGVDEESLMTKQGELLSSLTGIDMTPAQVSGSKSLSFLENAARQSIFTADDIAKHDQKVAKQALNSITKLAEKVSKPVKGAETIGRDIQDAVKVAVDDAVKLRSLAAKSDYAMADDLAGGAKVVARKNYIQELRNIVDEYKGSDMEDAVKIVAQAQKKLDRAVKSADAKPSKILDASGAPISTTPATETLVKQTVKDAVNDRSFLGAASKGTGNVFKDVEKNLDRTIASRLHSAITKDLLDAEDMGDIGKALRTANDRYAANSQSIKAIEKSPLGRFIGEDLLDAADLFGAGSFNTKAGEDVAKKITKLAPSEIRLSVDILERANPQVADDLRAFVIRDAVESAIPPPSAGIGKQSLSFNKFMSTMGKNNWKAYGFKPADIKQMQRIIKAMERVGDRSGYNWSQTAVQNNIAETLRDMGALATGQLQRAGASALQMVGLKRIAKAMTTPEGRKALTQITKPQLRRNTLEQAISVLENIDITGAGAELGEQE